MFHVEHPPPSYEVTEVIAVAVHISLTLYGESYTTVGGLEGIHYLVDVVLYGVAELAGLAGTVDGVVKQAFEVAYFCLGSTVEGCEPVGFVLSPYCCVEDLIYGTEVLYFVEGF